VIDASREGRLDDVRRLLDTSAVRPSLKDDKGWSPLHYACQNGHAPVVDLLLEHDYNPQIETSHDRDTPLHLACANAHTQVVSLLVSRISRRKLRKNRIGNNPLHLACKVGCVEIVKALLEAFPNDAYTTNAKGTTPFGYAVSSGHKAVVNLLLEREAGNPTRRISDFSSLFSSFDAKLSLDPPINIFVVGDRQCGKSTLIKSLHQETLRDRFWGIRSTLVVLTSTGWDWFPPTFAVVSLDESCFKTWRVDATASIQTSFSPKLTVNCQSSSF